MDIHNDIGTQDYRGLKLSFQRRATSGVSLSGNYTLSRCFGDPAFQTGGFPQIANGYTNPDDPAFDRGPCDQDRAHIVSFSAGAQMPQFSSRVWRGGASGWRGAGLVSALSGPPGQVIARQDRALPGSQDQPGKPRLGQP